MTRIDGRADDELRPVHFVTDYIAYPEGSVLIETGGTRVLCNVSILDLCYAEDASADADLNVAMTGDGRFVEVQGTAEGIPFDRPTLDQLLDLAACGIEQILQYQREALAEAGVFR